MSSIIKVNTYQDANGNALFSSDGSGNVTLTNFPSNKFAFHAYLASNQSISSSTYTTVQLANTLFNVDSGFDTANYRFKPTELGKYLLVANMNISGGLDGTADSMDMYISQYDNSASGINIRLQRSTGDLATGINGGISGSVIIDYTDLNDYYTLAGWQNGGAGRNFVGDSSGKNTFLCGFKLGA